MLFAVLAATGAIHALAVKVDAGHSARMADLAVSVDANPAHTLDVAKGIVDSIMLQTNNATEHMTDEDQALLKSVIELIRTSMYGSMDSSHAADEEELAHAIEEVENCNLVITARQEPHGDLGMLHQGAIDMQTELNRLRGIVDEKTAANATAWSDFSKHMSMIASSPGCPPWADRTQASLDVYFEQSEYVHWFSSAREPYFEERDIYIAANDALVAALAAHSAQKARLDVKYCDWKSELEQGCVAFNTCFAVTSDYYSNEVVPRVQSNMDGRIKVFQAGEIVVSQVHFLLGTSDDSHLDESRYQVNFPALPDKALCDLTPLTSSDWDPPIDCIFELVGSGKGACRDAEGGTGIHNVLHDTSEAECKAICREDDSCLAVEIQTSRAWCEIHTAPIKSAEWVWWLPGVECYTKVQ